MFMNESRLDMSSKLKKKNRLKSVAVVKCFSAYQQTNKLTLNVFILIYKCYKGHTNKVS